MSIAPIAPVTNIPSVPYPFVPPPFTDVAPLTYRDGTTYLEYLRGLNNWIQTVLIPYIDDNLTALGNNYLDVANNLITEVNNALAGNVSDINGLITTINNQIALINTAVSDTQTSATDAANSATAASTSETNAATSATNAANSATAAAGSAVDAANTVAAVNDIINNGRLSDTNLRAEFDRKYQTNLADFASLQAAVDGTANYGRLYIPSATAVTLTTPVNISRPITIYGDGSVINQTVSNIAAFNITSSDVHFEGLIVNGAQYAAMSSGTECGFVFTGASTSQRLSNISVKNCTIQGFGYGGIWGLFVTKFTFSGNTIFNMGYMGIIVSSGNMGVIENNSVDNVIQATGAVDSYGIAVTHAGNVDISVNPPSDNIIISKNRISNVQQWEGIDTHGGTNLTISNNNLVNCRMGIALVPGKNNGTYSLAPQNITVIGNTITNTVPVTDNILRIGIEVTGTSTAAGASVASVKAVVIGNVITGYGCDNTANTGSSLWIRDSVGCVIQGNIIQNGAGQGIRVDYNNFGLAIIDNSLIDIWANSATLCAGIHFVSGYNQNVTIEGNMLLKQSVTATLVNDRGLNITNATADSVRLGQNNFDSANNPVLDPGSITVMKLSAVKFGAYGATPVIKPANPGTATGTDATVINALIAGLRSQGLLT